MSEQLLTTIVCPRCGNINAYSAEICLKCGLSLKAIREALSKESASAGTSPPSSPLTTPSLILPDEEQLKQPTIEIAAIEKIISHEGERKNLSKFYQSRYRALIPGMADRLDRVVNVFFRQIEGRQVPNVMAGRGQLSIDKEVRDYYVLSRALGDGALALMALRFDVSGRDLYVEWRHYEMGRLHSGAEKTIRVIVGILCIYPFGFFIIPLGIAYWMFSELNRDTAPTAFQKEDSWAFKEAVDASLEEALSLVGISKDLIQVVDQGKKQK